MIDIARQLTSEYVRDYFIEQNRIPSATEYAQIFETVLPYFLMP